MKIRCNSCMSIFDEDYIYISPADDNEYCPCCGIGGCLMDVPETEFPQYYNHEPKEDANDMNERLFTIMEMENMFEIGRNMQAMECNEEIEIGDNKTAFAFALKLACEFEKEHPNTEEYYLDLDEFVIDKIAEEFGVEM